MSTVLYDNPGPRARFVNRIVGIVTVLLVLVGIFWTIRLLNQNGQLEGDLWEPFVTPTYMELIGRALLETLKAAAFAIAGAVVFGVIFGIGKLSEHAWIRWPSWLVVEFFRAVPLLMLIIFIWTLNGLQLDKSFQSLVIGLVLYNGSVLAEVFRAGINALPKGQSEAAYALGMRKYQVMTSVLLPQAVKIMLPSIISQCIVALKDTSLGYTILAPGLTTEMKSIWLTFQNQLPATLVLLMLYLVVNLILEVLARWAQKKFSGGHKLNLTAVGVLGETEEEISAERVRTTHSGQGGGVY
ncbi:amino acid ABC transporter permease [Mumia zhuanghuii]|uniref:Amino acid ABC transporter permease n=2 Tax=Mumia TaxID=1546255 RepID=A0ABW1QMQ5_9ACTN|nr:MULTISPECIES: amino acid ABC transporter permease [Mumia]KAA1420643.1 amino acid ABC transporter permease [Mumia zhuanghuii]